MGDVALSGSCLCGSVAYELHCDARRFFHCHCERCRKASGTGHASNIILRLNSMTWTTGESLTRRYQLPEATPMYELYCLENSSPTMENPGNLIPKSPQ